MKSKLNSVYKKHHTRTQKGVTMKEYELRIAIMQADIKPTVKIVMLTILIKVDWATWTSTITLKSISDYCKVSYRSVIRALDELEKLKLISKSTQRINAKNTPTIITVNHSAILSCDNLAQCQNVSMDSASLSHNTLYKHYNTFNNSNDGDDFEHYKSYYEQKGYDITKPYDVSNLAPDVLEYRLTQKPQWIRLNKYTSYSDARKELLKRAQWLRIPSGDVKSWIKSEIVREGVSWKK